VPQDKATRVYNLHRNTLHALAELIGAAGLRHPGEIEPRHIVRRVSSNEIRLVANLYKFLKPGELLTNPKAHVVYEYYWPLATSKSFDPQPGNDAHIVVGREHALKELRREGMRAQAGTQIFRLLLHGWHVSRSIVRTRRRLHTHIVLRARARRVPPKFGGPCKQFVRLWKVSSAPPRRRTKPGPQGPGFIW
jgi:hypothetical protein